MLRTLRIFILSLPFLFLVSAVPIPVAAPIKRATVCNGDARLCDRLYSNVTYIGAHDSFAYSKSPLALSRNQEIDIPTQLSLGVRLLQAQAHLSGNDLRFCHTSCSLFDGGTVLDYLTQVKTWLDENPSEVVTLIFTNPEKISVKDVWEPHFDRSGIASMAYVPPQVPLPMLEWPTLGELIDGGKRVVVFLDQGADTGEVDYILPEFSMIWETPYSVTDPKFPCKVDRIGIESADTEPLMYMINHSLNINILGIIIPDGAKAKTTNGIESILNHANKCAPLGANRYPTFVLLDWVDTGEAFEAARILNGLTAG